MTDNANDGKSDQPEIDRQIPVKKSSSNEDKVKMNRVLSSYDRLLPRYGGNTEKRKNEESAESASSSSEGASKAKKSCNNSTKKEYSRLRTLVPALSERDDISKVEIIEETIRYIDALHHQLAARNVEGSTTSERDEPSEESGTSTERKFASVSFNKSRSRMKVPFFNHKQMRQPHPNVSLRSVPQLFGKSFQELS